ncbi:hypothetical protein [Streptomyces kronopolitis]
MQELVSAAAGVAFVSGSSAETAAMGTTRLKSRVNVTFMHDQRVAQFIVLPSL